MRLPLLLIIAGMLAAAADDPVFRLENLAISQRMPLAEGQPQPDHRLSLVADLPRNAAILRLLILALLALLLAFVGLLLTTGRMEVGLPVLGGVLFIGFAASQIGRDTEVARSPADDGR